MTKAVRFMRMHDLDMLSDALITRGIEPLKSNSKDGVIQSKVVTTNLIQERK